MDKYRIHVEMIEGEDREGFEAAYGEGMEAKGFVIIAKEGDGNTVALHGVSNMDIAEMIAKNDKLYAAAQIARGLREANEILKKEKMGSLMDRLFRDGED